MASQNTQVATPSISMSEYEDALRAHLSSPAAEEQSKLHKQILGEMIENLDGRTFVDLFSNENTTPEELTSVLSPTMLKGLAAASPGNTVEDVKESVTDFFSKIFAVRKVAAMLHERVSPRSAAEPGSLGRAKTMGPDDDLETMDIGEKQITDITKVLRDDASMSEDQITALISMLQGKQNTDLSDAFQKLSLGDSKSDLSKLFQGAAPQMPDLKAVIQQSMSIVLIELPIYQPELAKERISELDDTMKTFVAAMEKGDDIEMKVKYQTLAMRKVMIQAIDDATAAASKGVCDKFTNAIREVYKIMFKQDEEASKLPARLMGTEAQTEERFKGTPLTADELQDLFDEVIEGFNGLVDKYSKLEKEKADELQEDLD